MPGKKFSHGRGGAGNISFDETVYVDGLSYSPPVLTEKRNHHFSTGIGGAGNIRKFNVVEARLAQDVPEGPYHAPHATAAGRGGYGNIQEMHKRERRQRDNMSVDGRTSGESHNTVSTMASHSSTTSSIADIGVANWTKNMMFGTKV
jgi:hypothetical protein